MKKAKFCKVKFYKVAFGWFPRLHEGTRTQLRESATCVRDSRLGRSYYNSLKECDGRSPRGLRTQKFFIAGPGYPL